MKADLRREADDTMRHLAAGVNGGADVRDVHQQLLISIAFELRLGLESFRPCLPDDLGPRSRLALVERRDGAEIYLLVDVILQRRRQVILVIVRRTFRMVVAVVVMLIVAV